MRVAIYRRVSSKRQATTGASLDEQLSTCQSYAMARGWHVVADYVEAGRSAYRGDARRRPQFQAMIAAAERKSFDVVLVYELSRFGRRRDAFAIGDDLERRGVRLVSATEQFDVSTVEGFVTYSILGMQAELYSRMLSRRIAGVRSTERAKGRPVMRAPRGMRWGETGLEPDDDPALVQRVYDLADQGHSARSIVLALAADGHTISLSSLNYMLRNPAYAGMFRHGGELFPAAWQAIVSREQWQRVQAIRDGKRPANRVRNTVRSHGETLLAGLAYCANCGAKLHYEHHPGRRCYYRCSCRQDGGHCDARPSRADRLDEQIADLVAALTLPADAVDRAAAYVHDLIRQHERLADDDPAAVIEALRRLGRAYADGAMGDQEYEQRRTVLLERLSRAEAHAAPSIIDPAPMLRLIADLPALWQAASVAQRRQLLGHLFSQVYARRHTIYAVRPTALAAPALVAVWQQSRAADNRSSPVRHSATILLLAA